MNDLVLMRLLENNNISFDNFNILPLKTKYQILKELVLKLKVEQDYQEIKYCNLDKNNRDDKKYVETLTKLKTEEIRARYYAYQIKDNYRKERKEAFKTKVKSIFNK